VRWLLVGALLAETLPLRRRMTALEPLSRRLWRGRLAGVEVALLRCGVGPRAASRRTLDALQRVDADAVMSFGTCGSLVDEVGVGEVRALSSTRLGDGPARASFVPQGLPGATCVTVRRGVFDVEERSRLASAGAQLVEMEAAAVRQAAGGRGFVGLKVVSDLASAPPSRLGFALHAWRICRHALTPAVEKVLVDETDVRTLASEQ
jgi:nucleoside phosphorylase